MPEDADAEDMKRVLNGKRLDGEYEVNYWSGLHLLAGEHPSEYSKRVDKLEKGELSLQRFEDKNTSQWNRVVQESEFQDAEEFLNWYNSCFLRLRENAQQLIELIRKSGYQAGIISHTSTSLAAYSAEQLGADFVIPSWTFSFEDGEFSTPDKEKYADEKSHIVDELEDVGKQDLIFFGNGSNDVRIAEKADKAFMVENKGNVDYTSLDAFTGSFDEILNEFKAETEVKH